MAQSRRLNDYVSNAMESFVGELDNVLKAHLNEIEDPDAAKNLKKVVRSWFSDMANLLNEKLLQMRHELMQGYDWNGLNLTSLNRANEMMEELYQLWRGRLESLNESSWTRFMPLRLKNTLVLLVGISVKNLITCRIHYVLNSPLFLGTSLWLLESRVTTLQNLRISMPVTWTVYTLGMWILRLTLMLSVLPRKVNWSPWHPWDGVCS